MARPSIIEFDDVSRASVRLISQGKRPTVDAVYEAVGRRGSRTTINKHLKAFLESFKEKGFSALPSAIPEDLVPIINDFWAQALVQAGKGYEEERKAWEQKFKSQQEEIQRLNSVIDQRDTLLSDRDQFIHQQEANINTLEGNVVAAKDLVRARELQIADLIEDKRRMDRILSGEREEARHQLEVASESWARERSSLERIAKEARQAAEDARTQMSEAEATHNRLTDYWIMEVDDARQQVNELKERQIEEKKRWEADLLLQTRRADRYSMTISEQEKTIDSLKVCIDRYEGSLVERWELLLFCVEQAGGVYFEVESPF